jgi:hypothetical protein
MEILDLFSIEFAKHLAEGYNPSKKRKLIDNALGAFY